ncbi:NAD-dependent epimerase/dehydratase family protein [Salinarimonas rosea]|uniref:NAD-dependent epimerase/dehydratase family protein n=1 Tax=Salinarimonas rosea TaxID=552063 RepID=UPI000425D231|nr:NAD(P)-dependent oxidoreductase [Salinarimonas rosea]
MTAAAGRALGRVLLTGAEGFVGRALAARLHAAGHPVVASDRAATAAETRICDLTDAVRVDALVGEGGFATVLHCGAVSGPMVLADDPHRVWRINAEGTANLLEAARRHGAGRLVLCSTIDVYGAVSGRVDETTLPRPVSVYAASKLAAEHAGAAYAASFGMDVVSLRIAWVYGPGRRTPTQLEAALRRLVRGEEVDLDAHPADPAHYLHLDDAVEGILTAAAAPRLPRPVYDIAPDGPLSLGEVAQTLGAFFPQRRVTCTRSAPGAPIPRVIDVSAASSDFGYVPRVRFEEGVARLVQSFARTSP